MGKITAKRHLNEVLSIRAQESVYRGKPANVLVATSMKS